MFLEQQDYKLALGRIVQLFQLDLTVVGGGTLNFTPNSEDSGGNPVKFGGISYYPVDLVMDGFEMNTSGVLPRPTIKIANTTSLISDLVSQYKDLVGSTVTRIRTFENYLDGAVDADPTCHYPIDKFFVQQKSMQTKMFVEFTLSSAIDLEGQKIPRRIVLHDFCMRQYRVWNPATSSFDYSKASCPYTGTNYFLANRTIEYQTEVLGIVTEVYQAQGSTPTDDPTKDKCSKTLEGCIARFGGQPIPGWMFPGAGRF